MRGWSALFVSFACASDEPVVDARVFDACEQLVVSVDPRATAEELATVDGGIAAWHAIGVTAPVRSGDAASVHVVFEPAGLGFYGLYDATTATVYVNSRLAGPARAIALAHELGHALGLPHVSAYASVMNEGNLAIAPNPDDAGAIERLWGACSVAR